MKRKINDITKVGVINININRRDFSNESEFINELSAIYKLEQIVTTSERNGYPSNLRYALIGFETFEQAKEIAERHGLIITSFIKHDGWQLWYRTGNITYEAINVSADDFGDDYAQFTANDAGDFYDNEVKPMIGELEEFDSLKSFVKMKERIYDELLLIDENQLVITLNGEYYDTIDKQVMSFYNDTKHTAIGIMYEE